MIEKYASSNYAILKRGIDRAYLLNMAPQIRKHSGMPDIDAKVHHNTQIDTQPAGRKDDSKTLKRLAVINLLDILHFSQSGKVHQH